MWPLVANALAGAERPYDDDDIVWVLGHAGWHIIEAGEDGQAVYRLAHQALTDNYHGRFDEKELQGRLVTTLTHGIAGGGWLDCDHYLWRHLADHAAKAGRLGELVRDPGYLAVADPARLVLALPRIESAEGRRFAEIYNRVADRLVELTPVDRMASIHMTAQMEDPELAPRMEPPVATVWRRAWARTRPTMPHRIVGKHPKITSVALGAIDGRPVVVSGSGDNTIRLWDAWTREPIGAPLEGHTDSVTSVAFGAIDGRPVVVSGGRDRTIRLWDARTNELIGAPLRAQTDQSSVAFGTIDGRPVIASGSWDNTLRLLDARTSERIGAPLRGHTDAVRSVSFGMIDGRPVVASGSRDGTIRLWDARTGEPIFRAGASTQRR